MNSIQKEQEIAKAIRLLHDYVGKDAGLDALNTVLDDYKRRGTKLDSFRDSDLGNNKMGLRTTIVLDPSRGLRWLKRFTAMLKDMSGVYVWHNLPEGTITLIVGAPHKLGAAPPGSHEWARGYITAKNVHAIQMMCDHEQILWQKIEYSNQHNFRVLREFNEPVII